MLPKIRRAIGEAEILGIDTQPLRDLFILFQSDPSKGAKFQPLLTELFEAFELCKNPVNKAFVIVSPVIEQIKAKLSEPDTAAAPPAASTVQVKTEFSPELMGMMEQMLKEVQALKSNAVQQQYVPVQVPLPAGAEQGSVEVDSLGRVFINPIDQKKVEGIKSNVSIKEKEGTTISDRLRRLRGLLKKP